MTFCISSYNQFGMVDGGAHEAGGGRKNKIHWTQYEELMQFIPSLPYKCSILCGPGDWNWDGGIWPSWSWLYLDKMARSLSPPTSLMGTASPISFKSSCVAKEIKRLIYQGLGLYHLPDGEARPELAEAECKHALQPGWQAVHIETCRVELSHLRYRGSKENTPFSIQHHAIKEHLAFQKVRHIQSPILKPTPKKGNHKKNIEAVSCKLEVCSIDQYNWSVSMLLTDEMKMLS
ncbi:hypothetical protein CFP56_041212 [Quercus suber]|uniref:Uncharacterized protein n=1 Tax=Quercus suber TaxID=58331 RepID=A0AAW0IVI2_QUESU